MKSLKLNGFLSLLVACVVPTAASAEDFFETGDVAICTDQAGTTRIELWSLARRAGDDGIEKVPVGKVRVYQSNTLRVERQIYSSTKQLNVRSGYTGEAFSYDFRFSGVDRESTNWMVVSLEKTQLPEPFLSRDGRINGCWEPESNNFELICAEHLKCTGKGFDLIPRSMDK